MSRSSPARPAAAKPAGSVLSAVAEAVRHIVVVLGVGMALATVFTAWTPAGLLPSGVADQIAEAVSQINSVSTGVPPTPAPTAVVTLPRIGIVAGHSGPQNDPGAVCQDGLTEAAVNLDIATRVKAGLEANGFQVDLLHEFDDRLVQYQALAVISIHNDSCAFIDADPPATGFKVAGAVNGGAPDKSERLVACLIDRYPKQTGLPYHAGSVTRDMTEYHTFSEVASQTPVAIIETGFLNLDRRILTEEPYRVAQGVLDGILCYVLNEPIAPVNP